MELSSLLERFPPPGRGEVLKPRAAKSVGLA